MLRTLFLETPTRRSISMRLFRCTFRVELGSSSYFHVSKRKKPLVVTYFTYSSIEIPFLQIKCILNALESSYAVIPTSQLKKYNKNNCRSLCLEYKKENNEIQPTQYFLWINKLYNIFFSITISK